jgi:hypothetical protein
LHSRRRRAGEAARTCKTRLKCAPNRAPCGHGRNKGLPSISTTCCAKGDECVLDPNQTSSTHLTRCEKPKKCPSGREPCGHSYAYLQISGEQRPLVEMTRDTHCCSSREKCVVKFDYAKDQGKTSCKSAFKCAGGTKPCGGSIRKYGPVYDVDPGNFDNYLCCNSDQVCNTEQGACVPKDA